MSNKSGADLLGNANTQGLPRPPFIDPICDVAPFVVFFLGTLPVYNGPTVLHCWIMSEIRKMHFCFVTGERWQQNEGFMQNLPKTLQNHIKFCNICTLYSKRRISKYQSNQLNKKYDQHLNQILSGFKAFHLEMILVRTRVFAFIQAFSTFIWIVLQSSPVPGIQSRADGGPWGVRLILSQSCSQAGGWVGKASLSLFPFSLECPVDGI